MSKPINFDKTLIREVEAVRKLCDKIYGGRTKLAKFLGIRPAEVSRYLAGGRRPSGDMLLGMQEWLRRNQVK
jgi:transcriptional regulator with XRE-family HTH domain